MKKLNLSLCVLFSIILLNSCSENSSPTNTENQLEMADYFPHTQGSWWIFQNYLIDPLGNSILTDGTDSLFVWSESMIDGKEAISLISVSNYGGEITYDTSYYHIDGSKLYVYQDNFEDLDSKKWMLYIDLDANEWQIVKYEEHIDTVFIDPMTEDSIVVKSDYIIDFNGIQNGSKNYIISGNNVQTKGFKLSMKFESNWQIGEEKEYDSKTYTFLIWLGKNVGFVNFIEETDDPEIGKTETKLIKYFIGQ